MFKEGTIIEIGKYKAIVYCMGSNRYYLKIEDDNYRNDEIFLQFGISEETMLSLPGCRKEERSIIFPYYYTLEYLEKVVNYLKSHENSTPLNHLIKTILKCLHQ